MEASLEEQFAVLNGKLAQGGQIFASDITSCLNFAVDANAADRADLTIALLEPLSVRAGQYPGLWQLLGLAYRAEQVSDLAVAALAKAVALSPQDARIAAGHATATLEHGLPAAQLFRTARQLDPENLELTISAAAALVAEGNAKAAIGLLEKEVDRFPEWARGHHALSTLRWTQGETTAAFARSYAKAVSQRPQDLGLRLAWLRHIAQTRDYDALAALLTDARAALGERLEFDAIEAVAAAEHGDTDRTETLMQKLSALDDPGVLLFRIRHALKSGRPDQAESIAEALLETKQAAVAWPYLSLIWRLTGNAKAQWLDGDPPLYRLFDLDFSATELDALAVSLRHLHLAKAQYLEQSVRGGTQTDGNLFLRHEPEIQAARRKIEDAVRDYVSGLPLHVEGHPLLGAPQGQFRFAGSWSVRLAGEGFHVAHTHSHGWISSAMYVALPDAEALGAPPAGWLRLGAPPPELGLDVADYGAVEPKPGRLVLFPSTMWHATEPFGSGERLTMAFDIMRPTR